MSDARDIVRRTTRGVDTRAISDESARTRNMSPIVPRGSISGRALIAVVAIMTFLASITTGAVLLVRASATQWQSDVASEITIQLRSSTGRDIERDVVTALATVKAQAGIIDARAFSKEESAKLLEPWLGTGFSIDDLPIPRVIVARVAQDGSLNIADIRQKLVQAVPSATVDDHRAWIDRMRSMTGAIMAVGTGILILVIIATVISVSFATRGAMAANRPIVEVLHFVGAQDSFIANRFFRHFLRLGLEGGIIGGVAAILVFGFSESIASWFSDTPVGDQFAALLGTFALPASGYLILAAQALLIAAVTAWASRRTLFATLDDID